MKAHAHTATELLLVTACLALLVALALPGLAGARRAARNAACLATLRQIATAHAVYRADHRGAWPANWQFYTDEGPPCAYDPLRRPLGYMLVSDSLDARRVRASAVVDARATWSAFIVARDAYRSRAHSNAGYFDGHSAGVAP